MPKFQARELVRFLQAVDAHLNRPFELLVIGGSAAALAYDVKRATGDIDTWGKEYLEIASALEAARKETGLDIPVQHPGVQDGPWDFQGRVRALSIPGLRKLVVKVPEKHDLVLMKAVRGEEPDLQAAEEIHANHGLEFETLVNRYLKEMAHVVGRRERIDLNFLGVIDRLFGEERLGKARERIARVRGPEGRNPR